MAISDKENARIYFGKNIEYSGRVTPYTRIYIYGPNIKPTYIRTGIEAYEVPKPGTLECVLQAQIIKLRRDVLYANNQLTVNIYDTNMNLVQTKEWPADEETLEINTSSLKSGQYIVSVLDKGTVKKSWNIKI